MFTNPAIKGKEHIVRVGSVDGRVAEHGATHQEKADNDEPAKRTTRPEASQFGAQPRRGLDAVRIRRAAVAGR